MQLHLQNITKYFPGVKALDGVTLTIRSGEIHAICGENGAGKSTLLNIITGNEKADEGNILIDDQPANFSSPMQAFTAGIAIVHQHLSLVESLSIAENIFASFPPLDKYRFLDRRMLLKKTAQLLQKLELNDLRPGQLVSSLSAGQKQMIEIAKALASNPSIVFFDEPTASISKKDVDTIFKIIRQLKHEGKAIVYISHRLQEIFTLADTITVLKDGKNQGNFKVEDLDSDRLIRLMVGREINQLIKKRVQFTESSLEVKDLNGPGFKNISFTLHKREILGMAGLVGAGRTAIAKAIFGAIPVTAGNMEIKSQVTRRFKHPVAALLCGIGYVPEDRKTEGLFPDKSIAENIYVTELAMNAGFKPKVLNRIADKYLTSLNIRTPSVQKRVRELSGGNQQKVLLARWLQTNPDILILDEPTHGIDVGTKFEIYRIIQQLAEQGKAILLISSEMSELIHLCHRIMVIKDGSCMGILDAEETSEEKILSLAMKHQEVNK